MAQFSSASQDSMIDFVDALGDANSGVAPVYPKFNSKTQLWVVKVSPYQANEALAVYHKVMNPRSEYGLGYMQGRGAS